MGIPFINIFGDSLVIINWENNVTSLDFPYLDQWCKDIRSLMNSFSHLTIKHIYREHNQQVDCLSKKDLDLAPGFVFFTKSFDGLNDYQGNFQLF